MTFLMSAAISGITIAAAVIVGIFILVGVWKGLLRSVLTIVVIGASVGFTALFAPMILNAMANKNNFNQEWLTPAVAEMLVFLLTFAVLLAVFSIIKALVLKALHKMGALRLTNRVLGGVLGGMIGFFLAGMLVYVYVVIMQTAKELPAEDIVATLDPFAQWMYKIDVFRRIRAALVTI